MNGKPAYFESVQLNARKLWDQLESDPELAGPWHQLFKQVQSPRHVLSELLQNADDAGATEASVEIEEDTFVFSHNGEDFREEHFASLCRFGYSNKRALHTIGFRGIGFKSTFSLGDTVELETPSLSIAFDQRRFTEPRWIERRQNPRVRTLVRVPIRDEHRKREIEKNLLDWLASPVSLLFFKHIRRMRIGAKELHWGSLGPGPVLASEWMALHDDPDTSFLVVCSEAEPFPEDALHEIRQERLLGDNQGADFPPCKVEIVLGAKGRLYVVLPTGVETKLPFACNAPFIQDPARLKIKDPETSPTNRWLLGRAGKLAALGMRQWLERLDASVVDRSDAFGLLPDVDRNDNSLEGSCATVVEESFEVALGNAPYLLTGAGELKPAGGAIIIPDELFVIWPAEQAVLLFDAAGRPPLSSHISRANQQKLLRRGVVDRIDKAQVLKALQAKHLPKPDTWQQLLRLWAYVAPDITGYRHDVAPREVRIVPVQGSDVLYAAREVVRLGDKRLLQSDDDWEFLSGYLVVLNPNWPRFLAEQRRAAEERQDRTLGGEIEAVIAALRSIELDESDDVGRVIAEVAGKFFSRPGLTVGKCVRLAQISAKLGASVGESFRFCTRDNKLRPIGSNLLIDRDGALGPLFDEQWCEAHFLHGDYAKAFQSCTADEWQSWASSGRSGLLDFAPVVSRVKGLAYRSSVAAEIARRGGSGEPTYSYKTNDFHIDDRDFEEVHWKRWQALASDDSRVWGNVIDHILERPEPMLAVAQAARMIQTSQQGYRRAIYFDPLLSEWILRLRELPCLPDTHGNFHKPGDLLCRTPETESLMGVEPFVQGRLDNEATRPLLKLLGVRDVPTGPERILNCLRSLATVSSPPTHEVEKWYRRLDQLIHYCSTESFIAIQTAFQEEKLILSEDGSWTSTAGVFLYSDEEDVPGAAIVRSGVRDLTLWHKIKVADRPTADLAIQWLRKLPSGKVLSQEDARRVGGLLAKHSLRIWDECQHWLNLSGEWVPVGNLAYALSMQSLVNWAHLHEWVKQATADLRRLSVWTVATHPFSGLRPLSEQIEDRIHRIGLLPKQAEHRAWLNRLGSELQRIELDDEAEQHRIRTLAVRLADAVWQSAPGLEIIPYIDATPAGVPRRAEVVWLDGVLYVEDRPIAKLARAAAQEIGRSFRRAEIADAIKLCFDRTPEFVTEYMEENFNLCPQVAVETTRATDDPATTEIESSIDDQSDSTPPAPRSDDDAPPEELEPETPNNDPPDHEIPDDPEKVDPPEDDQPRDDPPPKPPSPPKPAKVAIIERFADALGFEKDGTDRFFHEDGSWIAKTQNARFPWERRKAGGDLVRYYWPKEHCLEREPLQLEADIWGLLGQAPDVYALILSDPQGNPIEVTGSRLRAMHLGGKITLHPAAYRLVLDHDHKK